MRLDGEKIYLKELIVSDIGSNYVTWMNDYQIVKFTESRFAFHTQDSIKEYVEDCLVRDNCFLFAIFDKVKEKHIGNIKIDEIHKIYKHADLGL